MAVFSDKGIARLPARAAPLAESQWPKVPTNSTASAEEFAAITSDLSDERNSCVMLPDAGFWSGTLPIWNLYG